MFKSVASPAQLACNSKNLFRVVLFGLGLVFLLMVPGAALAQQEPSSPQTTENRSSQADSEQGTQGDQRQERGEKTQGDETQQPKDTSLSQAESNGEAKAQAKVVAILLNLWNAEITKVDGQPVTVGKVVMGLILLIGFIWVSGIARRRIFDLMQRLGMRPATASVFKTLIYYGFICVSVMITLDFIQIPLTVFTLLGGAVAIGVGFGSQNLVNNFISGLILLAEQPIRINDLIQIGDLLGNVKSIGGRSTMLRTGSNVDIIIPNSSFLEKDVINWTLGDDQIRTSVSVGVAYGSPAYRVKEILLQAVASVPTVLPKPDPMVLFVNFGDNTLDFEVHFWIHMKFMMDRYRAESLVRFEIDRLFHEEGITIAFPQRDVHLDMEKPLEVRVLNEGQPSQYDQDRAGSKGDLNKARAEAEGARSDAAMARAETEAAKAEA